MDRKHKKLVLILTVTPCLLVLVVLLLSVILFCRKRGTRSGPIDTESGFDGKEGGEEEMERQDLVKFQGGEDLTAFDILDAPGEVIGKSSYGTLYRANLTRSGSVVLLRFLRPACCNGKMIEVLGLVKLLGSIRHPNLVPLCAFYAGPRGEKLFVHPFYLRGNLAQFIRDGSRESHKWTILYKIATGIARGLDYLHTGLQKPVIHGNLKSKNILLGRSNQPFISDFGLHLLLNPKAAQEMLDDSAVEGYKAPELVKLKDANEEADIYSLGVIFLELLTGKEPISEKATLDQDSYLPTSIRKAILDHRISDLYHPDILLGESNKDQTPVNEERILNFFQLAMACCSPSPSLRPDAKQVLRKLEEI